MDGFTLFGVHRADARIRAARARRGTGRPAGTPALPLAQPQPDPPDWPAGVLALPHPDWLFHRANVTGPSEALDSFRQAAAGAGVVPWRLDYDRMEEDWFHMLVAPRPPGRRTISVAGARILAGQLRQAMWERYEEAVSRVGYSRACPFDLFALLPVPDAILRLGPDDPAALSWLWTHWGTVWTLRHVIPLATVDSFRYSFWAADWTPWPAIRALRARWPTLHFAIRPVYQPGVTERSHNDETT
jgi:hypothetical protein